MKCHGNTIFDAAMVEKSNQNEKKDKTEETVDRIVAMAKVLFGLHMVCFHLCMFSSVTLFIVI